MLHKRSIVRLLVLLIVFSLAGLPTTAAPLATSPPLGAAESYLVVAGSIVTNTGPSTVAGDLGVSPSIGVPPHVTGFPPGIVAPPGAIHDADAHAAAAQAANLIAFGALSAPPNVTCTFTYDPGQNLSGLTLAPGVYCFPTSAQLTTGVPLTLDGGGDPAAVWIFRMASTLDTTPGVGATVTVTNAGCADNVWWQVGSSAALGSGTTFIGNILALTSISLGTGANLEGRVLAQTGAVTLDTNHITRPICALAIPSIATEIHNVDHLEVTSALIGTVVHDMATVTGTQGITPTGTVTFTVYPNRTCTAPGTFAGAVPLDAAGVADPSAEATLTDAGLSYLAHYGGDEIYDPADGPCEVLRPLAVPIVTTAIHNDDHAEVLFAPIGTIVHDMATVTGTLGMPTGTVSFTVYANPTCSALGTFAGTVPLNGLGVAHPSYTATLESTGLSYLAHYSGDTNYTPANGPCEVLVAPGMPRITTAIHNANHAEVFAAPVGTIVHDMATVTGTLGTPTGTVTFTVYANQACSALGTFAGTVPLNGLGVADPSYTATLTSAGLSYLAHYSGDTNYSPADGPCEVLVALPTAVELLYFRANAWSDQHVQLTWATALEVDNFGFNLYRARVNDLAVARAGGPIAFVPTLLQGSGSGATYAYVDTLPAAGSWWYWLSDVDTTGFETFHSTPANITVQSDLIFPYHVYLPSIRSGDGWGGGPVKAVID